MENQMRTVSNTGHLREGGETRDGAHGMDSRTSDEHMPLSSDVPGQNGTRPQASEYSTFVDKTTGEEIADGPKMYSDVSETKLPPNVERRHGQHLRERFGVSTHAGVKTKHLRALVVLGRIGWVAKGLIYALIGGLCCRAAISKDLNIDASPQGVFVLIGSGVSGIYVLIIMAVSLATYICWRFWEGITAQGSHPCYSKFKNFFTFRLSPLVSGFVYTAYLAYILTLVPKAFHYHDNAVKNTQGQDFTASWQKTGIGRFGLVLVGIAFLIAAIVMLQGVLTKKFHRELRLKELRPWVKWLVLVAGHVGQFGRFALFLLVSVLMWRALSGDNDDDGEPEKQNTVGKALNQLQTTQWGRAILFIIGWALIVYGLFATLCCYPAKIFPTPLPSPEEREKMIAAREEKRKLKAEAKSRASVITDNRVPTATHDKGDPGATPV